MRDARRTRVSDSGPPVTATTTRSRASQVSVIWFSSRYFSSAASTWSASHSSASSRSAVRLSAPEVVGQRGVDALRCVDVAVGKPAPQRFRRDVDQLDLVGGANDLVGHLLLLLDAGDLGDDVVEALQVLDVDRRDDRDARVEQLLDVLPAFGVPAAGGVGVGELVDEDHLRLRAAARRRRRARGSACRGTRCSAAARPRCPSSSSAVFLRPCVSTTAATTIGAALQPAVRLAEHRVRLADAGRRAQVDAQLAALLLVVGPVGERLIGCHMLIIHRTRQLLAGYFWSSSRLSFSTLTVGSPKNPSQRPSVLSATACRIWSGLTPRALATRFTCRSA